MEKVGRKGREGIIFPHLFHSLLLYNSSTFSVLPQYSTLYTTKRGAGRCERLEIWLRSWRLSTGMSPAVLPPGRSAGRRTVPTNRSDQNRAHPLNFPRHQSYCTIVVSKGLINESQSRADMAVGSEAV